MEYYSFLTSTFQLKSDVFKNASLIRIFNWPRLCVAVSCFNLDDSFAENVPKDVPHEKDKFGLGNSNLLNLS